MAAPHRRADIDPVGRRRQDHPVRLWRGVPRSGPGRTARNDRELRAPAADRVHGRVDGPDFKLHRRGRAMKFFAFHLMPYAALDPDYDKKHNAAWVTLPNSYYDPK